MKKKRVLIGCEFSGRVREAFRRQGCDAWSCDMLESEIPGNHIVGDVLDLLYLDWDIAIFHPPCRYLAVSGARWFKERQTEQQEALKFVKTLMEAPIEKIALENPVSVISTAIRKPDQIIHPWQFNEPENKTTCIWLKNLPPLVPTGIIESGMRKSSVHLEPPGPDRWKNRSRTYQGIANAMAQQWSKL